MRKEILLAMLKFPDVCNLGVAPLAYPELNALMKRG